MKRLLYAGIWSFVTGYCFYGFVEYQDTHMIFISGCGAFCGVMLAGWEIKAYFKQKRRQDER